MVLVFFLTNIDQKLWIIEYNIWTDIILLNLTIRIKCWKWTTCTNYTQIYVLDYYLMHT